MRVRLTCQELAGTFASTLQHTAALERAAIAEELQRGVGIMSCITVSK
jgi:hypothetical protein